MKNNIFEDFKEYVKILERIDVAAEKNEILRFSPEEREVVRRVQVAASNDKELEDLLNRIKSSTGNERQQIVDDFFNKKANPKSEEEEIAKVYGVDPRNIQSKTLNNGKVIFSFFDFKLNRLVVLENGKDGKSLVEFLEELQNENEEYQSTDDIGNATNIMDDQRKKTSMELEMISVNEIGEHESEIDQLSKEDKEKLNFLILNAERLGVRKVNIENLIYSDSDNNIKEIVFDKNMNIIVADPDSDKFEEVESTVEPEPVEKEDTNGDEPLGDNEELDKMFEEIGEIAPEKSTEKPKVLMKVDDSGKTPGMDNMDELGIVNNVLFILIVVLGITLTIFGLIYFM